MYIPSKRAVLGGVFSWKIVAVSPGNSWTFCISVL